MFETFWVRSALRKLLPVILAFVPLSAAASVSLASAYAPVTIPSLTKTCYYKIYGKKFDGTAWSTGDWKVIGCGLVSAPSKLDFSALPDGFGTIPDGVYFLQLTAVDNADNWMDTSTYGAYRVDTSAPKCDVTEVRLLSWASGNQYFDKATNSFYYKGTGGSGKFSVTVDASAYTPSNAVPAKTCGAGGNEYCAAPLDTISFENTIGPGADYQLPSDASWTTGTFAKVQTHTYDWTGNNSFTGNLLSGLGPSGCKDLAGNTSFLKPTNTKLVYEDGNLTVQPIGGLTFAPDTTAPTLSTSNFYFGSGNDGLGPNEVLYSGNQPKYLSALSNRKISASVSDAGSGIRPFDVAIEKAGDKSAYDTYSFPASTYNSRVVGPLAVNITHDFSNAGGTSQYDLTTDGYRPYDWSINTKSVDGTPYMTDWICDMVGNCNPFQNTEFRIVANVPDASKTAYTNTAATKKIANGADEHFVRVKWRDQYDNWVIPVKGVKTFTTDVNFTNSLGLDQVTTNASDSNYFTKGTGVDFFIEDGYGGTLGGATHSASEKKNFKYVSDDPADFGMGETWVKTTSSVPTYAEYRDNRIGSSIYGSDATRGRLDLNQLKLTIAPQNSYTSVGQDSFVCVGTSFECAGSKAQLNYAYEAPTYFSSLEKLEPIVENKQKDLDLVRTSTGSANPVTGYQLRTFLLTNNPFYFFYDFQLDGAGSKRDDKYFIAENNTGWPVSQYSTVDSDANLNDVSFAGINGSTTRQLSFIPKTVGGITNSAQNIALVSTLRYKVNGRYVQLPGVQVGLSSYDNAYTAQVSPASVAYGSVYSTASKLTLSEIDIRGIVQSKNDGSTNGMNAVTTDSASTKFRDFSSITLYDVKTNIQKNVAALISGAKVSDGDLAGSKKTISTNFSAVAGGLKLQNNDVLYFKNGDVVIDCGGGDAVCDVTGKKTLIIENGNLYINSNIRYADNGSILGLILVGNKDGTKSHVYVSEKITNISAVAYAEGAVQSYDGDSVNPKVYNGKNVGESNLLNQLHWYGSLATRNTIGGGIKTPYSCPFGTPEYRNATTCNDSASHQYDLIYLRRYARADKTEYPTVVIANPMGDGSQKVPTGIDKSAVKIAGGISFAQNTAAKTAGPAGLKTFSNLDTPFAVEYDSRLQSSPPPGFEKNN